MLTALQYVPRPGATPDNPDAAVGAYAFSATLAIQDITGLATSGITTAHVAKRLENSTESQAYLFALTTREALRPVTDLGYPEPTDDDLLDIDAWVFTSLPLLEDLGVIEANVILDASIAPLPGEEVPREPWEGAFTLIDALSHRLTRPTRHLWVTHAPGEWELPGAREQGFTPAFREDQAVFTADAPAALPALPSGTAEITVAEGPGFAGFTAPADAASEDAIQFAALLTAASRGYPRGELALEPIEWDLARITDAGARLRDRGGNQLTGVARVVAGDGSGGRRTVGLCEAVHFTSDSDAVCELGLIYVLPEFRGRGIGQALIRETVSAARTKWEDLETVYVSAPAGSAPADAILGALGAKVVSSTTAWQKV